MNPLAPHKGLYLIRPPYLSLDPLSALAPSEALQPGVAAIWFMFPRGEVYTELEWLWEKPRWVPLFVVLPEPKDVATLTNVLRVLPDITPRGVLPNSLAGTTETLRLLLASPPRSLTEAVVPLLSSMGWITDVETRVRVGHIFSRAAHVTSVEELSRALCQSRRTLGRFFRQRGLPVPSHWLQFARILHVSIQLQNTRANIGRISARFGYPDGFTMSNSMKRLIGHRPSFVRRHLGWEWIVAAWVNAERKG